VFEVEHPRAFGHRHSLRFALFERRAQKRSPPSTATPSTPEAARVGGQPAAVWPIESGRRHEDAYGRIAKVVALIISERETIIRALEECPEELVELRATLLQKHWRRREGL
jgi:hypothetical protein